MSRIISNTIAVLSLVSLIVGGRPSGATPAMTDLVQSALAMGRAIGTATGCPDIAPSRVKTAGDRFTAVLDKAGNALQNPSAVRDAYVQGMAFGQRAIETHQTDCATADRELATQERAAASLDAPEPAPPPAAQATGPAPTPAPTPVPAPSAPAPAVTIHGITDKEIRFGMVAAFSGPSKTYGPQLKAGIMTAFNAVNETGGINGRKLSLFAADDGFDATRTLEAMKGLYEQSNVFGYVGNYGTPTMIAALPFALSHRMTSSRLTLAATWFGAIPPTGMSSFIVPASVRKPPPRRSICSKSGVFGRNRSPSSDRAMPTAILATRGLCAPSARCVPTPKRRKFSA
jgi:hypothetical protein